MFPVGCVLSTSSYCYCLIGMKIGKGVDVCVRILASYELTNNLLIHAIIISEISVFIATCINNYTLLLKTKFNCPGMSVKLSFISLSIAILASSIVTDSGNEMSYVCTSCARVMRRFIMARGLPTQLYGPIPTSTLCLVLT